MGQEVTVIGGIGAGLVSGLLEKFAIDFELVDDGTPIPGSYWGDPEAGIIGSRVFARADTPVHSVLHETCHLICMSDDRREILECNAGGNDIEEAAVCYLQIVLADFLTGVGRHRLMRDMDAWGYSFRLGSSNSWFMNDAGDAEAWLASHGLLDKDGNPSWRLRR